MVQSVQLVEVVVGSMLFSNCSATWFIAVFVRLWMGHIFERDLIGIVTKLPCWRSSTLHLSPNL